MRVQYAQSETKKVSAKLPKLLGLLVLALLIVQIGVSNRLANYGSHLNKIEQKIADLTEENGTLEEHIASSSSLLAISDKAGKLGFTVHVTPLYISHDLPVARIIK